MEGGNIPRTKNESFETLTNESRTHAEGKVIDTREYEKQGREGKEGEKTY